MFTYVHLKNFKSFKDVEIHLNSKKKEHKPLIVVYGANGSGKTTISQAFMTLQRTMQTMQLKGMLKDLLDEKISPPEDALVKRDALLSLLKSSLENNGIENLIRDYKMINSDENMSLEYEFIINGNIGSYYIEMDSSSIVKERLEYKLNKNKGCYIDISSEGSVTINERIFESKDFLDIIHKQIEMYWGKHSFLSILSYEISDKSDTYVKTNISSNLMSVFMSLDKIDFCLRRIPKRKGFSLNISDDDILANLASGEIDKKEEDKLDKIEKLLNSFFAALFDDVKKVYYKKTDNAEQIKYRLHLTKQIEDYRYDIDFRLESNGTQEVLSLVPFLMSAISGKCVVIDEYGIGMHDLLAAKLLEAIAPQIKGQLIITTHNTLIMDHSEISPESLYFIMNDRTFKKSVKCVTEIETRTHPNNNYRNRYFTNSLYRDALPSINNDIDLTDLADLYK